jgi:hypothetical protein
MGERLRVRGGRERLSQLNVSVWRQRMQKKHDMQNRLAILKQK